MQFRNIIGQQAVKDRLIKTVGENRISHAQLILGPSGSGALPIAIAYAQFISCTNKVIDDSCGECPSCKKFAKLAHPDLHFVFPIALSKEIRFSTHVMDSWREAFLNNHYLNLNDWFDYLDAENKQPVIGTEESSEILRKLSLTTYESEYKIMVIWLPEKMNHAAANKLLKILEEPPDKTLFLLVCENEDQLLRTIVSRTQLVKVNKIPDEELKKALIERHGISAEEALKITHLCDGSYNEAKKLLQENESAGQNMQLFRTWMLSCLKFDAQAVVKWTEEMSKTGRESQKTFFGYAQHIIRECMMMNNAGLQFVKLEGEELDFVKKFGRFVHNGNIERFVAELNKAQQHIERNANPKILFMDLSFKMNEILNIPAPVVSA